MANAKMKALFYSFKQYFGALNPMKKVISALLITTFLTGCGFHLRGEFLLPESLQTLYVSSTDTHGELTRVIKQHLKLNKVKLATVTQEGVPQLRILKDRLNRRTLSVFPNGQVAEYELIYTVKYQLIIDHEQTQDFSFELNRDYQDDPDKALAKSRELSLILSELRREAADHILRNLSSYNAAN